MERMLLRVRLKLAVAVALAVLLSAQLVLHNHALFPEGSGTSSPLCAVCVFGADRITTVAALIAPSPTSWTLPSPLAERAVAVAVPASTSRGPPAAA
jgi:hypothetical protein